MKKRTVTVSEFQREIGNIKESGWNAISTWISVMEINRQHKDDAGLKATADIIVKAANATKRVIDDYIDSVRII
jgi:hypothetical protein